MSFRSMLAAFLSAQLMMPAMSHAALGTGEEINNNGSSKQVVAQQKRMDGYVLMKDTEVQIFDLEDEQVADYQAQNSNSVELNINAGNDSLAELGFGKQGEELNSAVILPQNTRFFVTDAVIDQDTGARYIQVELESGMKFWTGLKSFDTAMYVAEGQVAGRAAGTITSRAGWRVHPISRRMKCHEGTDIAYPSGTPIGARVGGGKVVQAGWVGGYGKCVTVHHSNGMMTRYGHLSSINVRIGQSINAGDNIGRSGCTGSCTGPHLHFENKKIGSSICGGRRGGKISKGKKAYGKKRAYKRSRRARR